MIALADRTRPSNRFSPALGWAGYMLGFAIGGFFDGILLHQVLQWHHLLSGLQGGRFDDLRFQIMADGLFHLLMYLIGFAGLYLLWRSHEEFAAPGADRFLAACALIGLGVWHILDAFASHWFLGIHRIRMDSATPLVWDLAWFIVFGILPLAVGWLLRTDKPGCGARPGAAATLTVLILAGGTWASLPPAGLTQGPLLVVFRPGVTPGQAAAAMNAVAGRLVWSDPSDQVWAIEVPEGTNALRLYAQGALVVGGSLLPAGCLGWTRGPVDLSGRKPLRA